MTFIKANDVAELIGFRSADAFLSERRRLERDHDFPVPMPTCLRPLKWRRDAIEAWVELQGCNPTRNAGIHDMHNVVLLDEARRA